MLLAPSHHPEWVWSPWQVCGATLWALVPFAHGFFYQRDTPHRRR